MVRWSPRFVSNQQWCNAPIAIIYRYFLGNLATLEPWKANAKLPGPPIIYIHRYHSDCAYWRNQLRYYRMPASSVIFLEIHNVPNINLYEVHPARSESKWHRGGFDRLMFVTFFPCAKLSNDVPSFVFAPHHVFVDDESIKPNRTSGMDLPSAYANLCSKPIPEAVCKPRTCVNECTRRVYTTAKRRRSRLRFCYDRVCVPRSMMVDKIDRALERGESDDGNS